MDGAKEGRMMRRWVLAFVSLAALSMWACGSDSLPSESVSLIPTDGDGETSDEVVVSSGRGAEDGVEPSSLPQVDKLDEEEGRWRRYRTQRDDPTLTPEQRESIRELEAIGYLDGSQSSDLSSGAHSRFPDAVQPGLNLYTSGHAAEALLIDREGVLLHRWGADFWDIWPDYPVERTHRMSQFWRRVRLLPDGGLLAIYEGLGLVCLNSDSTVRWAMANRAHHDLDFGADGSILVLTREARIIPRVHPSEPILEDFLTILDPQTGEERRRISILEAVEASAFETLIEGSRGRGGDIYHTNAVWFLDEAGPVTEMTSGRVILYLLGLGSIVVLDLDEGQIVWASTGPEIHRHDPRLLDNGHVLIFNNFMDEAASTVTELDPSSGEVMWRYEGTAAEPFYSKTCGTAQRLDNGNTLITESDNGRAIEVDATGRVVWEFVNPHRAGPDDAYIASLFELERIHRSDVEGWLRQTE
jgi:hypothetical protein